MEFKLKKKNLTEKYNYNINEKDIANKFSKRLYDEIGDLLFSTVLFGSSVKEKKREQGKDPHDIDVLVLLNDTNAVVNEELIASYKLIIKKIEEEVSTDLHVTTIRLTKFWMLLMQGDAVIINIIREGLPVFDRGVFLPLKSMLFSGLIRPSPESVYIYHNRSKATIINAKAHLLNAVNDLYWAVIDSAHALLMSKGIVPPTPDHISDYLKKYKETIKLEDEYIKTVDLFYRLYKAIDHKKVLSISGDDYDNLYEFAKQFVDRVNTLLNF